jgi:hypothetical protein
MSETPCWICDTGQTHVGSKCRGSLVQRVIEMRNRVRAALDLPPVDGTE